MEESVSAPVEDGQKLGEIIYTIDGEEVTRRDVCAAERVDKINAVQIFLRCLADWLKL